MCRTSGVVVDVVFAEVECDGAVGYWEAGCGVWEAIVIGGLVVYYCHGEGVLFYYDTSLASHSTSILLVICD